MPAPVCQLLDCTTILFQGTIRLKTFSFVCVFLMYHLCEKYYKPIIVQCYPANCVSWVDRLTLLDLGTNWTNECALKIELIHV